MIQYCDLYHVFTIRKLVLMKFNIFGSNCFVRAYENLTNPLILPKAYPMA